MNLYSICLNNAQVLLKILNDYLSKSKYKKLLCIGIEPNCALSVLERPI